MSPEINKITIEVQSFTISNAIQAEEFRLKFLVKKGLIPGLFTGLKDLPPDQRKSTGEQINNLRNLAEDKLTASLQHLEDSKDELNKNSIDVTLPPPSLTPGSRHPISIIRRKIINIFSHLGFNVSYGPEIEDDWHNFTALNMDENHPARCMQDTVFVSKNPDILLRTHTSNVQIRVMNEQKPPIRTLSPGRTYRNEVVSARASCMFHQVEGLYVDEQVSFADLKQTLFYFVKEMFGNFVEIRFRASYFPFTEPSAEVDISCLFCKHKSGDLRQADCTVCKNSGWVEIMGAGMVDPAVLTNCKIDTGKYSGFAFGMGIERIAMLKYAINDIRLFTENDIRFINQFQSEY